MTIRDILPLLIGFLAGYCAAKDKDTLVYIAIGTGAAIVLNIIF